MSKNIQEFVQTPASKLAVKIILVLTFKQQIKTKDTIPIVSRLFGNMVGKYVHANGDAQINMHDANQAVRRVEFPLLCTQKASVLQALDTVAYAAVYGLLKSIVAGDLKTARPGLYACCTHDKMPLYLSYNIDTIIEYMNNAREKVK